MQLTIPTGFEELECSPAHYKPLTMPQVNPEVLVWARESAGLDLEEAAKKLNLKDTVTRTGAEKLNLLETGKLTSTSMLRKMSKQYHKPLIAFYMKERPAKVDSGEDFRTLHEAVPPQQNALVETLLGKIEARQGILKEAMIAEDEAEALEFIGRASLKDNPRELAESIKQFHGIDLGQFRAQTSASGAFKYLRTLIEEKGVYVLLAGNLGSHHSNIDAAVFRGFVLSDEVAPFIVINDQDARSAWSFTLLHELIHLWLGKTGLSDQTSDNQVEQFCDTVASQILLPQDEFDAFMPDHVDIGELVEQISEFANTVMLSRKLVAYRLLRRGDITPKVYGIVTQLFYREWRESKEAAKAKRTGAPDYYVVKKHRIGNALFDVVKRFSKSGALSSSKSGILLDVSSLNANKLLKL
jgi:Zn-dependent peptidase ImmA (M78 family)